MIKGFKWKSNDDSTNLWIQSKRCEDLNFLHVEISKKKKVAQGIQGKSTDGSTRCCIQWKTCEDLNFLHVEIFKEKSYSRDSSENQPMVHPAAESNEKHGNI